MVVESNMFYDIGVIHLTARITLDGRATLSHV